MVSGLFKLNENDQPPCLPDLHGVQDFCFAPARNLARSLTNHCFVNYNPL